MLEIPDDTLRWKATKAWEAATELLDCVAEWRVWLGRLESGERVGCLAAIWLHDRTGRAANTLCGKRAIHPDITPMEIVSRFPDPPEKCPGWASRYDIPRAKAMLSMLDHDGFEDQWRAIRIHIETWPEYLQADDALPAQVADVLGLLRAVATDLPGAPPRKTRRRKTDPGTETKPRESRKARKADRQLWDAWAGGFGSYVTYADLAKAKGLPARDVKLAIDRHRKRLKRAGKWPPPDK